MTSDNLHTDILDNLQIAILLVNADLRISYLNSSAEALLEVSGNRVVGDHIEGLFADSDPERSDLLEAIKKIRSFTKRENQITLPSGQSITVDCAVTPVFENDTLSSFIIEIQPLDRLLRISREENLLSAQQHAQTLVRGLAHEIKNPLGGLRGAAQLLAKALPNEELKDYTNIIIEEADRLSKLVDRMLGSHSLLDLKPLNIHEVLERVKDLVNAETCEKITIERLYDPSLPEIKGDKERLIQAMLNIVRNAMQSLLPTLEQSTVENPTIQLKTSALRQFTIGTQRHRLVCHVQVCDNGPGISKELLETIFLPMVSGRADGTGLGLSISQSIINHHQGLIECDSVPGRTEFSIYIPLQT